MENLNLKYDFNAICEMENVSDMGIMEIINSNKITYTLRLMLWGGMLKENPKITLVDAGDKINELINSGKTMNDIIKVVFKALEKGGILKNNKDQSEETEEKN